MHAGRSARHRAGAHPDAGRPPIAELVECGRRRVVRKPGVSRVHRAVQIRGRRDLRNGRGRPRSTWPGSLTRQPDTGVRAPQQPSPPPSARRDAHGPSRPSADANQTPVLQPAQNQVMVWTGHGCCAPARRSTRRKKMRASTRQAIPGKVRPSGSRTASQTLAAQRHVQTVHHIAQRRVGNRQFT